MGKEALAMRCATAMGNSGGLLAGACAAAICFVVVANLWPAGGTMPANPQLRMNREFFWLPGLPSRSAGPAVAFAAERCEKSPGVKSSVEESSEAGERTWRIKGACQGESSISSGPGDGGYVWRIGPAPSIEAPPDGDCCRSQPTYRSYPHYPFIDIIIKPDYAKNR